MRRDTTRTIDSAEDTTATIERRGQQAAADGLFEHGPEFTHGRGCDGDTQRTTGRGSRSGGGY